MLIYAKAFARALMAQIIHLVIDIMPWSIRQHLTARMMAGTGMVVDESTRFHGGWAEFKQIFESYIQQSKALKLGDEVSDIELVSLATKAKITLKSLQRENVPLVLNFGSCT